MSFLERHKRLGRLLIALGIFFGVSGFAALCILFVRKTGGIPCPFFLISGLHCPGCGTTRAILSLLELDIPAALGYNAFAAILLPLIAIYAVCSLVLYVRCGRAVRVRYRLLLGVAVALLVFGIIRNIPLHPFTLLIPGGF